MNRLLRSILDKLSVLDKPSVLAKVITVSAFCICFAASTRGQEPKDLKKKIPQDIAARIENENAYYTLVKDSLTFHCDFNRNGDAIRSVGDGRIYTNESLQRKEWIPGIQRKDVSIVEEGGVALGHLRFSDKSPQVLSFKLVFGCDWIQTMISNLDIAIRSKSPKRRGMTARCLSTLIKTYRETFDSAFSPI
jgi:hypothetical protein